MNRDKIMDRQLLIQLHSYFSNIGNPTDEEQSFLTQLTDELPYFSITSVSRDDLRSKGFDVSGISDDDMEHLASEMANTYCDQLFWENMEYIASERMDIPKSPMPYCPVCKSLSFSFDFSKHRFVCQSCSKEWSDNYVLVQHPEDASFFEDYDIGYPCFNVEDNGARYVPKYDYIKHFQKDPAPDSFFSPLLWPESQNYLGHSDSYCEAITAYEKALNKFGSTAVWVPVDLLDK